MSWSFLEADTKPETKLAYCTIDGVSIDLGQIKDYNRCGNYTDFAHKKRTFLGFPGGAVVGSLPASAEDAGSGPGLGGSRMLRSGWARGPQLLSLRIWSLSSATGEAAMVRGLCTAMRSGPHLPRLEEALAQR